MNKTKEQTEIILNEYTNNIKTTKNNLKEEEILENEFCLENLSYERLCTLKKKEIVSSFRMGYSVQERIIDTLKINKEFEEYPNLIFYSNNGNSCYYKEIDRVLLLKKRSEFKLFKNYLSVIQNKKTINEEGIVLNLEKNSINFLEIKRSVSSFEKQLKDYEKQNVKEKNKEININEFKDKGDNISASKNSNMEKTRTDLYYSIKNIKEFLQLYEQIGLKYDDINLIYIFDSNFSLEFINILIKLIKIEIYNENVLKTYNNNIINLIFVQVKSDYEVIQNIEKQKIQQNEIENLNNKIQIQDNSIALLKKEQKELRTKFEIELQENKDLKQRFEQEQENNKRLREKVDKYELEFLKELHKKKIKNNIKNIPLQEILNSEKIEQIDLLIGKNYYDINIKKSTLEINKNIINDNKYKTILDTKTFFNNLIDEDKNDNDYIKYNNNYDYFLNLSHFNFIILFIDHVFLSYLTDLKKKYFNKYDMKVVIINLSLYLLILEKIKEPKNKETCLVKLINHIIPGFKEGEYEFYLDNDLITYFKKLEIFQNNIKKNHNGELVIYCPNNKSFQYLVKYIYLEKKKNQELAIYIVRNNLSFYPKTIENAIEEKYDYSNNLIFYPTQFNHNASSFLNIANFFDNKNPIILDYSEKDIINIYDNDGYKIIGIITANKDYFVEFINEKQNYLISCTKVKFVSKNIHIGDVINEIKINLQLTKTNYRPCVELNYISDKIKFFISTIFYMKNFDNQIKILLLGDEYSQIKYYLSEIFISPLLEITHVHNHFDKSRQYGQALGFIKKIYKGKKILELQKKYIEISKQFDSNLKNEIVNNSIIEYIELIKNKNISFDIILIDEQVINIEKSLTLPSFEIFKNEIDFLKRKLNENGILCFNLIGYNKFYYDEVKKIIEKNFFILKDESEFCSGYFILTKNETITEYAKNSRKLFRDNIGINIKKYIESFLSKN